MHKADEPDMKLSTKPPNSSKAVLNYFLLCWVWEWI